MREVDVEQTQLNLPDGANHDGRHAKPLQFLQPWCIHGFRLTSRQSAGRPATANRRPASTTAPRPSDRVPRRFGRPAAISLDRPPDRISDVAARHAEQLHPRRRLGPLGDDRMSVRARYCDQQIGVVHEHVGQRLALVRAKIEAPFAHHVVRFGRRASPPGIAAMPADITTKPCSSSLSSGQPSFFAKRSRKLPRPSGCGRCFPCR